MTLNLDNCLVKKINHLFNSCSFKLLVLNVKININNINNSRYAIQLVHIFSSKVKRH